MIYVLSDQPFTCPACGARTEATAPCVERCNRCAVDYQTEDEGDDRTRFLGQFVMPLEPYDQTDLVWAVEVAAEECGLPSDNPEDLGLLFDWLEEAGIVF